jgi:selenocysteine lyase/cysteine desulfurase
VDAIQTLGAVHLDAEHVDFVCADAHKWLLGPKGIAVLWARHDALQKMRPAILGWLAVQRRDHWFQYDTTPINSGERFEPGARNLIGIVALDASLEQLELAGADLVHQRVTHLRDYAAQRLTERGCTVLWQGDASQPSGIVSFQPPSGDAAALYRELDKQFALSLRDDPDGQAWIRISAHYMNCEDDIDRLVAAISR